MFVDMRHASIVSGYFNPLHVGHLRMMEEARALTGYLIVIVNNDVQQMLKKGRIILPLQDRLEIVRALRVTDEAVAAVDEDSTVRRTLRAIREKYPDTALVFANGGDRSSAARISEADTCEELGIELRFGIGGEEKADSSTRIIAALTENQQFLRLPTVVFAYPPALLNRRRDISREPGTIMGRNCAKTDDHGLWVSKEQSPHEPTSAVAPPEFPADSHT